MSQKYIKSKNNNSHNAKTYGKYYTKTLIKDVAFEELHENLISAGSKAVSGDNPVTHSAYFQRGLIHAMIR